MGIMFQWKRQKMLKFVTWKQKNNMADIKLLKGGYTGQIDLLFAPQIKAGFPLANRELQTHSHWWEQWLCVWNVVVWTIKRMRHFEIGIMYHFPSTQKLDGVSGTNPVLDYVGSTAFALLAIGHIGQGYVVPVVVWQDGNLCVLYCYLCHICWISLDVNACIAIFFVCISGVKIRLFSLFRTIWGAKNAK